MRSDSQERLPACTGLQPGAEAWKLNIKSPAEGTKVTGNSVTLEVAAEGYRLDCASAGKPVADGVGHYHVLIDKSLVDMYCTPEATVSMQNVKPGKHTLAVVPAQNDHNEVMSSEREVEVDYEPSSPLPPITDATTSGKPSIKILEPKAGQTLSGPFTIRVQWQNFSPSCDLYGKPGVAGFGHWHANLDSSTGPMMGMGTMLGMSCEQTLQTSTTGLDKGSTHTVIALLVDNGHAPLMPEIEDKVEVKIA